jgi:hypothetical protein
VDATRIQNDSFATKQRALLPDKPKFTMTALWIAGSPSDGSCIVAPEIGERLDAVVNILLHETLKPSARAARFSPVHFSQVQWTVHAIQIMMRLA